MSLRFIHTEEYCRISFLYKAEKYSIVWLYHIILTHSFTDGRLCCFQVLVVVNNAAIDMGVQISLQDHAFNYFGYMPRTEIAENVAILFLIFLKNCHVVFHSSCTTLHSH